MKLLVVLVLAAAAACGGSFGADSDDTLTDANPGADAAIGCVTGITYTPNPAVADADTKIRAVAHVTGSDVQPEYTWFLSIGGGPNITPPAAQPDNSEVEFPATQDAVYRLRFRVADLNCPEALEDIDVNAPGTGEIAMRVHVVAPPSAHRAPFDETRIIQGGAQDVLDPGVQLAATSTVGGVVIAGGTGVEAYLKFSPNGDADAATEAFADSTGSFTVDAMAASYQVLIVPKQQTFPPQIHPFAGQTQNFILDPGIAVSGTVKNAANAGIVGAKVQLVIDGLPSTIATTTTGGAFTVRAMPAGSGASVRVEVTPPAALGLPRLVATSAIDVTASVDIKYAAITTRDLGGTTIQRGGPLANAGVSIVGTLANAGTVNGTIQAAGEIRQSATTNGSGALPTLLAPATTLDAVIFPGAAGDHAVTPIDLTNTVPNSITAAATVTKATRISNPANTIGLAGAVIDAVPKDALALAGAPTIRKIADANGQISIGLAPNGKYDLRLADPNGNRGALTTIPNATSATAIAAQTPLLRPTIVSGLVTGGSAVPGAVVRLLCTSCSGLERDRPVAEGLTGPDGRFSLAIPDPN